MTAAEFERRMNAIADTFIAAVNEAQVELDRDTRFLEDEAAADIPVVMRFAVAAAVLARIGAALGGGK